MDVVHVPGEDRGRVVLYALSTCGWCAKTKQLLTDLGVEFSYLYVDRVDPAEFDQALEEVERWNPRGSFPTLVINDEHVIVGFQEDAIREALHAK
ncbi:glutaredoxin family protein [Methanoculleus sp. FWC-SCC1]|uniref:Glutaredoxin family protein n=1 Tax=Methanoculleus frigidifontis TaxID=2584085 RepID=A0ABT8MAJ1_9EURY|nr:glutaredoxin family protein [Methanoculleus sp. FWC-SCC1]MDN7024914.1 glutaredoxin family protein [Methanoculleus sp. FWC-SCC1]